MPSKGLLILLLGWQVLSIHGQGYFTRHHHPIPRRPTTSPVVDTARQANPNYPSHYDAVVISKTTPSSSVATKAPIDTVNSAHPPRPSFNWPYDNVNVTRIRTTPQPTKYTECTAANAILNFARVGLKRIGDAFIESSETKELYLDDNSITEISSTAFVSLSQLEVLSLSSNMIPIEKLLWFSKIYTLRKLVIDDNRYDSGNLSKMLEALPRLEELSLQRDNISRFAVNLKEFAARLTHLQLCGNNIDELDFLDDLPDRLSYLYLDDNKITKVRSIALKNVQELSVSGNQIEKLCSDQCTDYYLSLKSMNNLQKLNASRNSISEITDDAFLDTVNLMSLDLSRNRIRMLPLDVLNLLSKLQELSLSHNELGSVPKMCHLIHLKQLDLSYNNVGSITRSDLCNTTMYLHTLLLSGNHITDVDGNAFMQLPALRKLDLSNNLILHLPVTLIHGATSLQTLLLRNNSIANIDRLFAARSKVLQELHLQDNPFCTVKYEQMPQLVMHLKDQRQAKDNEEEEEEDATNDHDVDENSVDSLWG